jgi:hypothetical protein
VTIASIFRLLPILIDIKNCSEAMKMALINGGMAKVLVYNYLFIFNLQTFLGKHGCCCYQKFIDRPHKLLVKVSYAKQNMIKTLVKLALKKII